SDERARDVYAKTEHGEVKIPSNLRNYSFFEHENHIYFKTSDRVCSFRFDRTNSHHRRAKTFIELRDTTRELLTAQELDKTDSEIKELQAKLNRIYDNFYKKYGLLHNRTNRKLFSEDVSYNLVCSLEKEIDKDKLVAKSDLFTKRTIRPPQAIEHVESAVEALTLSMAEKAKVNFQYMSELTGLTEEELKKELEGQIFKVPHTENEYQTASEYLSGDIYKKLREAEEIAAYDSDFSINISALKQAIPTPLKAGDIEVKIGAAWIDPKLYQQFLYETLNTPYQYRDTGEKTSGFWRKPKLIQIEYSKATGTFHIEHKREDMSVNSMQNFGTRNMNAYEIMEHLLNLKEPKIYKTIKEYDEYGAEKEKRVLDTDATRVVQKKAEKLREEFSKWIFKDPQRREQLVNQYNEQFNSVKPREYDGSALKFPMMNSEIQLHEHQKNAVAHALFGGNTLFAHTVGAGKTFEMIATAMEAKRLGLCTKSLFAVPNHLTEQIGDDFMKLYPSAHILVATKNDFKKENRQQLFAKIATGNFDAVIIGHSQLGMIPVSKERQTALIQEQIDDIITGIEELKQQDSSKFQVKQMERTRKSLEAQLEKLEKNHDDT
ncbi:MAG: DEAD/DEAH box helicase family protein, partial [Oscillospiraceae bacterium]|nr:DEAD/DEAH box helicase family protein [Oscillospiraceae bacterium]